MSAGLCALRRWSLPSRGSARCLLRAPIRPCECRPPCCPLVAQVVSSRPRIPLFVCECAAGRSLGECAALEPRQTGRRSLWSGCSAQLSAASLSSSPLLAAAALPSLPPTPSPSSPCLPPCPRSRSCSARCRLTRSCRRCRDGLSAPRCPSDEPFSLDRVGARRAHGNARAAAAQQGQEGVRRSACGAGRDGK